MFKIEYDLSCLTCDELIDMRAEIQHAIEEMAVYHHEQSRLTDEERHLIAQALAIDEETGEWPAGA